MSRAYDPPSRPSLAWMGVGRSGGWRNYAKNVQLVNRARGAGFGGRGWSRKGSEQGVLVWCAMTLDPPSFTTTSL